MASARDVISFDQRAAAFGRLLNVTAITEPASPDRSAAPDREYDAFISYSSSDVRTARRIQLFLEKYRSRALGRRLRIFLDQTDLRGGELTTVIQHTLETSRALIVCASPAASESRWVGQEVQLFRQLKGDYRIAVVVVSGKTAIVRMDALGGVDFRRHDVRRGWTLGVAHPRTRLELLRLLGFVSDVQLRRLRNWYLRRLARNFAIGLIAAAVLPALILSFPLDHWDPVALQIRDAPRYAIAAQADGERLWVASRFRAPGPQGFRNYILVTADALAPKPKEDFSGRFDLSRRLLPVSIWPPARQHRIPRPPANAPSGRAFAGPAFAAEPHPGRFIIVQPLALTEEEAEELGALAGDVGMRLPTKVNGALITIADGNGIRSAEVDGLTPVWKERAPGGEPTSPSRGLAVAWTSHGQIWLGVPGWDAETSGGLWHSSDLGGKWTNVEGFSGVTSIALDESAGREPTVVVAESHFDRWRGPFLEPYPSRVVMKRPRIPDWAPASTPPFGTRSEIELVGVLNGSEIVRVDERLYRRDRVALWRFLRERLQ